MFSFLPSPTKPASPVKPQVLFELLSGYDPELVDFLVSGFFVGFRLGFQGPPPSGPERNNLSADSNSEAVSTAILKELKRGHTAGPFESHPLPSFFCSPLGAASKKDGTKRIILDLSFPPGSSVNDGIPVDLTHVQYTSLDEALDMIRLVGPGCFMGKIDIQHAFRLCPVHPDDWPLLGYRWQGRYFFDLCLPFGSRSSPCIFNMFADALQWVLVRKCLISAISHYLDDFILCAPTFHETQCKINDVQALFNKVGVPIALDKLEGPSQVMTYLGIEIDTISSVVRLPKSKLSELKCMVFSWRSKRKCTKRELLSLIGSLSFACKVIRPGRIF